MLSCHYGEATHRTRCERTNSNKIFCLRLHTRTKSKQKKVRFLDLDPEDRDPSCSNAAVFSSSVLKQPVVSEINIGKTVSVSKSSDKSNKNAKQSPMVLQKSQKQLKCGLKSVLVSCEKQKICESSAKVAENDKIQSDIPKTKPTKKDTKLKNAKLVEERMKSRFKRRSQVRKAFDFSMITLPKQSLSFLYRSLMLCVFRKI